ncbi:MAG: hypothetical protein Kow00106_04940 [Anaerolineae bacterium]
MDSGRLLPGDSWRRLPAWPPYVARDDDEEIEEIIEADDLMARSAGQAWGSDGRGWVDDPANRYPPRREESGIHTPEQDDTVRRERAVYDGEILFAYGSPPRREPRHRPIIALTVNALGYHLFVSHEAKKVLVRLGLILVAVLMLLLWGDIAQAVELFFSIFVL